MAPIECRARQNAVAAPVRGVRAMSETLSKAQMLDNLRALLSDVFKLRREGAAYAKLSRAHGYVDGYMRSLLENGSASRQELLELVAAVRVSADGPATTTIAAPEEEASAA
jgi:hypothetical protein